MYLVVEPLTQIYIFTEEDPRENGYDGPVEQDVELGRIPNCERHAVRIHRGRTVRGPISK